MEIDTKKIFVYDTTNEFSGFIQQHYFRNCSIDVCADRRSIDNYNYSVYDVFFIIVSDPKDILLLFKTINNINSVLFLGTGLAEIKDKFKENTRIRSLDIYQDRKQLQKFIDSTIRLAV